MAGRIVVFGATGYTGGLTARALVAQGVRPVLAGRDRAALERLADELGGLETAWANADEPRSVRALVERDDVLVTTVGPFVRYGYAALDAAVDAGAHYLDCAGEHTFVREDTTFLSEGTACAAWLYRPGGVANPPIVVLAHGFAAFRELRLDAYAERFAQAGYAALVFDYRHWGASEGQPRRLLDIGRQRADWRAAVAYARSLDGIDTTRVVGWGSSFGGGHILDLAAHDHQLAAAIVQVGGADVVA